MNTTLNWGARSVQAFFAESNWSGRFSLPQQSSFFSGLQQHSCPEEEAEAGELIADFPQYLRLTLQGFLTQQNWSGKGIILTRSPLSSPSEDAPFLHRDVVGLGMAGDRGLKVETNPHLLGLSSQDFFLHLNWWGEPISKGVERSPQQSPALESVPASTADIPPTLAEVIPLVSESSISDSAVREADFLEQLKDSDLEAITSADLQESSELVADSDLEVEPLTPAADSTPEEPSSQSIETTTFVDEVVHEAVNSGDKAITRHADATLTRSVQHFFEQILWQGITLTTVAEERSLSESGIEALQPVAQSFEEFNPPLSFNQPILKQTLLEFFSQVNWTGEVILARVAQPQARDQAQPIPLTNYWAVTVAGFFQQVPWHGEPQIAPQPTRDDPTSTQPHQIYQLKDLPELF